MEAMLPGSCDANPRVGINASEGTIILRLTAIGRSQECQQVVEQWCKKIATPLGDLVSAKMTKHSTPWCDFCRAA